MNKHLNDLIELSNIDNLIDDYEVKINTASTKLKVIDEQKKGLTNKIESITDSIKEDKVRLELTNVQLKDSKDKLEKLSIKKSSVKTEKELKVVLLEEDLAKENINFANDDIARFEKTIQTKTENIKRIEEELKEVEKNFELENASTKSELTKIDEEKKTLFSKRENLVSNMDQKVIAYYQKIKRWAKNTTVVPVKDQACYGCFMKLNENTYKIVKRATEITSCPHCGRIIYYVEEQEQN